MDMINNYENAKNTCKKMFRDIKKIYLAKVYKDTFKNISEFEFDNH